MCTKSLLKKKKVHDLKTFAQPLWTTTWATHPLPKTPFTHPLEHPTATHTMVGATHTMVGIVRPPELLQKWW